MKTETRNVTIRDGATVAARRATFDGATTTDIIAALTISATLVRRSALGDHYIVVASHPEGGSVEFGAVQHRHGSWHLDGAVKAPWGEVPSEVRTALVQHVEAGRLAA
jgi:hypothetical protein